MATGIAFAFVPSTILAVQGVAPSEAGLASGLVNTSRLVGGALGLAVLAALATSRTHHDLSHAGASAPAVHAALTDGFHLAFLIAAAFALVGLVVAVLGLPGSTPRPRSRRVRSSTAEVSSAS